MSVLRGRVVLQKNGVGIRDLLVVVQGAAPAAPATDGAEESAPTGAAGEAHGAAGAAEVTGVTAIATAPEPVSLGSQLTGPDGAVEIDLGAGQAGRPMALLISVLAPEQPGGSLESRTLFTSQQPRHSLGAVEEFLVAIPDDALTKAGIALPVDPSVAGEPPEAAVGAMQQAVDYHASLAGEARSIAGSQVAAVRAAAQPIDDAVQSRLVQALTGLDPADAQRLNILAPGVPVQPTVWNTVNQAIQGKVNASTVAGYVALSPDEAQRFQDAGGTYRTDIPAAEIEPYIFQASDDARPPDVLRGDPVVALCRAQAAGDPLADGAPSPSGDGTAPDGQPPQDQPLAATDLPRFVGRIVAPMRAPEESTIHARPTAADVQSAVGALEVAGGPADVTAFYDFHELQIAFDFVWQQAIDDGVIEAAKTLCRQLADQGGDPVAALQAGGDPIATLRDEVRHVSVAQRTLQAAGVAARLAPNGHEPQPGAAFRPSVLPPLVHPPFIGPVLGDPAPPSADPGDLLGELTEQLAQGYSFQVFAPGSTNFGLLVTYRQRWDPITYQAGNLAKTLTLAPKEMRKVSTKRTVRVERSVKELEDNQRNRKDETSETMRDEAEIVQRAQQKTSFSLTAKGGFNVGFAEGDSTTALGRDADSASQQTKRQFHEAVIKSAQEFKDERKLEVEAKTFEETQTTDSLELSNPNDELTVTYLFYELQRRFRVSEHIHRLTPVVLVAMEVPAPNRDAIDRTLLTHSWIVNRVLLDDRYRPAVDHLCTRVVGDQMALEDLAQNVAQVASAVADLQQLHRDMQSEMLAREAALTAAIEQRADVVGGKDSEGILSTAEDWVLGGSDSSDPERAQILQDAAKDAYDRSVQEEKDLRMRLDAETATLSQVTERYAQARAEHANHLLQIAGLRAHFRENLLYYMQAIWSHTYRDQLFFSICNVKVPRITAAQKTYSLHVPDHVPLSVPPRPGQVVLEVEADVQLTSNLDPDQDFVTLAEVADLDNPIGFKGNYMVFPMRKSNPLTDFMMLPYVDAELGIHDPDELGSWTPEDFARYARCLVEHERDQLSASDLAALEAQLRGQYQSIVSNPALAVDTVVVPTSSLYIEALPGAHPLLEDFKLEHRAVDVEAARADLRMRDLESLRYAARLLSTELEDPHVDKKVVVDGTSGVSVTDT